MKGKSIISALCVALLICTGCAGNGGWTDSEKAVIASTIPGTDSLGTSILRVLTIADLADSLVLRTPCSDFTPAMLQSPEFAALSSLMIATVQDPSEDGVGIAGPQVGISRRIVAVQRFDKPGEPFEVYPNVRIVGQRGELCSGPEGCLSVPGRRGNVLRYRDIDIQYTLIPSSAYADGASATSNGARVSGALRDTTERIQGFTAVIFQHECDHLDGVLYIDKLEPGL